MSMTELLEKKKQKEEEVVAQTPNDKFLKGLTGLGASLGLEAAAGGLKGQKAVADQFRKVNEALGSQEQKSLRRSAEGFAWGSLKEAAPAGTTPTAKQAAASAKVWLNEELTAEDREEFLNAPWMIGATDGLLGGFEYQAEAAQKSAAKRRQERLNKQLSQAQGRAEDKGLDEEARRLAVWEAEDIRKLLTAAENELYVLNGGKRYAKVDMRKSMAALADTAAASGQQGPLAGVDDELKTKPIWKGHKSKDIDEGLALMFNGTPEKMTEAQAQAVKDFVEENGVFFKPESVSFFYDQIYPSMGEKLQLAAIGGDPYLVPLHELIRIMKDSAAWDKVGVMAPTEAALLAKVMDERVPLEDKGKYLRQMAEFRSQGEGAYETEEGKRFLETVDKDMETYQNNWEKNQALDRDMKIHGLIDAFSQIQKGEPLNEEQQAHFDDFRFVQLDETDVNDENYIMALQSLYEAEQNYWAAQPVDDFGEPYGGKTYLGQVWTIAKNYLLMDVMVAKSCGISYSTLLSIYPNMAWDMDKLYAAAVKEYEEIWGAGDTPTNWIAAASEFFAEGTSKTWGNDGMGYGESFLLGLATGTGEMAQGVLDLNAIYLCPPIGPEQMKRLLENKYLIPYGPIEGPMMVRKDMEKLIEELHSEELKHFLRRNQEACLNYLLADFNEEHLRALDMAYQNDQQMQGNVEKAQAQCTPVEYILGFNLAREAVKDIPDILVTKGAGDNLALMFLGRMALGSATIIPTHVRENYHIGDLDLTTEEFSAIIYGTADAVMKAGFDWLDQKWEKHLNTFGKAAEQYVKSIENDGLETRGFMTDTIVAAAEVGEAIVKEWHHSKSVDKVCEKALETLDQLLPNAQDGEKEAMLTMLLSSNSDQLGVYMTLRGESQWPLEGLEQEELYKHLIEKRLVKVPVNESIENEKAEEALEEKRKQKNSVISTMK